MYKTDLKQAKDIYLKNKLQDMCTIYENFENQLLGKYIDETERIYIIDCNLSNKKDYFKGQVKMLTERKVLKMEVIKIKRSKYAIVIFVKKV